MKFQKVTPENVLIEVSFDYQETCHNVYKHFTTFINGKKSNAKGLAKYLTAALPDICTASTYYRHPRPNASGRRSDEGLYLSEVKNFFTDQGFELLPYEN